MRTFTEVPVYIVNKQTKELSYMYTDNKQLENIVGKQDHLKWEHYTIYTENIIQNWLKKVTKLYWERYKIYVNIEE